MKAFLILSLLVLSQAQTLDYWDSCGTEYKDDASYIKFCISDSSNAGSDDSTIVRFYYSSDSGNLITSDWIELDNPSCNDYQILACDYFTGVPSDMVVLHSMDLFLDGTDGVQYGAIEVKYGDYVASFTGSTENDCISSKDFGTEYPEFITLDYADVCQAVRIVFADPDTDGVQYSEWAAAFNGWDGNECQCDQSSYPNSEQSGQCDTCYFHCEAESDCETVTENCGTINKYTENYLGICTSYEKMADSESDFMIRWNYQDNDGNTIQTDYVEGDNKNCNDFVLGKCDFFDVVPSDMVSINSVDIQLRGWDGWQMSSLEFFSQGLQVGAFGGYDDIQNECVTKDWFRSWGGNNPLFIWVDEDDICATVRIHFVDGIATTVYAIDECNCDLFLEGWSVGINSGDLDSCAAICYPDDFPDQGKTCDVVTIYSECDYGGEAMEVADTVDCLEWQPQSICVPEGTTVTIYDLCWYSGDSVDFESNESCMSDTGLLLLEQNGSKKQVSKEYHARVEVN